MKSSKEIRIVGVGLGVPNLRKYWQLIFVGVLFPPIRCTSGRGEDIRDVQDVLGGFST